MNHFIGERDFIFESLQRLSPANGFGFLQINLLLSI